MKDITLPLVSIVVPVYNTERFVQACIDSVICQSYTNWELILVDDQSSDKSFKICQDAADKDPRIKAIRQEKNAGALEARNRGIKESSGKFLCFLDSDDTYEPAKLEIQVAFMLKEKHAVSFTMFQRITEAGEFMGKSNVPFAPEISYKQLLGNPQFSIITIMLDTTQVSLPQLKLDLVKAEDYVFHLAILKQGFKAYGINMALSNYRYRLGSQSTSFMGNAADLWKVLYSIEKLGFLSSTFYFSRYISKGLKKKMILMSQIKQVQGN
ncbi:glycosyltransferase family 2 protein [Algoriphagus aquimarinus]|uniref:Teichuronic acid biosynthesis glycosyltransferase TuaG n=1 Tax=Algoriphagus aquimarinus TaxID=237018 RepID=A0A1I1A1D0_9BACT|nr:glycosyltransferase family 2 protein [Algoriphagus aquimarinus]SFB30388.1 teichuronic acid biosynthesis glycosyltransferase TuaG [Algoriphagus aquimarinus]